MALALFDLDNTLLSGDSDYLWGQFLASVGAVNADEYERRNQAFYDDYRAGRLDIDAFLRFSLAPLAAHPLATLEAWRAEFIRQDIRPRVGPAALALVEQHRAQGDRLVIITATNRFVTAPIAELFGIDTLLATEPERTADGYTGRPSGTPCFQDGKLACLSAWLGEQTDAYNDSWFYSDSINDLPLLDTVEHPHAVDPDPALRAIAVERGWPILSLHGSE